MTAYVNGSATNGNEKFRRQRDEGKNFTAALIWGAGEYLGNDIQ